MGTCESMTSRPSIGVSLDVAGSDSTLKEGKLFLEDRVGGGVGVGGTLESRQYGRWSVRAAANWVDLGVTRTTKSTKLPFEVIREESNGDVDWRTIRFAALKHGSGVRVCPYGGWSVGLHRFTRERVRSSGAGVGGILGLGVPLSKSAGVTLEFHIDLVPNHGERLMFRDYDLFPGGVAIGYRRRF